MIVPEWRRILEGKDKFHDAEVEEICNFLLKEMVKETNTSRLIELYNDLELALGSGEWLTRKYERLSKRLAEEALPKEEAEFLKEKLAKVKARRDEVVARIKAKYGL